MKRFPNIVTILLLFVLVFVGGTGCTLRVANYPAMPPFNFICSGKPSGLEPALLTEWANRRNWQLEYLVMDFAAQILAVQTGKADMAMGAISITEERQKQVIFSDGYVDSHIVLITRKGNAGILTNPSQSSDTENNGNIWPWAVALLVIIMCGGAWLYRRNHPSLFHRSPICFSRLRIQSDE